MKRWGPIIGVILIAAIVLVIVLAGTSSDKSSPSTTSAVTTGGSTTTGATGTITYPLSFSQAKAKNTKVDWGTRCDTTTGRLKVPDFFAPECYAPFSGDNGGATAQGVTKDTIKVVYYLAQSGDPVLSYITDAIKNSDTNAQYEETMRGFVKYYETYYETYGRKVDLKIYEGTGIATDPVAARADAVKIAETEKPFVVIGGPALTDAFAEELAARKITCIGCGPGQTDDVYAKRDPYQFAVSMSSDQNQIHVLEYIQKQLIGKPASHAGDPALVSQTRKFGLVYIESSEQSKLQADAFAAKMKDNGAALAVAVPYKLDPGTLQESAASAIAKLKQAGVTSVIFSGDPVAPRDFTKEATAQNYNPEWIIGVSTLVDTTAFARTYDQKQWAHAFGVTTLAARVDPTVQGAYFLYKWFTGKVPPAANSVAVIQPDAGLLYAILQFTGPNLTPQTFRDAFFGVKPTQHAVSEPSLSWGSQNIWKAVDYFGIDDATAIWWDAKATGTDEIRRDGAGMYQYVDGGKRYLPGEWPAVDKMFDPTGAVALYSKPPAGEEPATVPSPAG